MLADFERCGNTELAHGLGLRGGSGFATDQPSRRRRLSAYVKLVAMNSIQVADQTFVAADPVEVGKAVADPASWRRWWPDLRLTVIEDRGPVGHRWTRQRAR